MSATTPVGYTGCIWRLGVGSSADRVVPATAIALLELGSHRRASVHRIDASTVGASGAGARTGAVVMASLALLGRQARNLAYRQALLLAGDNGRSRHRGSLSRLGCRALPRPRADDPLGSIDSARRYFGLGNKVVQQLGPTDAEDLRRELAEDFEFVAPLVGPLGKDALIAATTGLDLGAGLPDFDARYHAFRVDRSNPRRVWCQMRVTGTHTGTFQFGSTAAEPKDPPVRVESPPEAVSITFNDAGQVREITTGYPLDRCCGNTGGLGGIFGIFEALGSPLPAPLTRTCGELLAPLLALMGKPPPGPASASAPALPPEAALPETRLLELAEALLVADLGTRDPALLGEAFTFSTPALGPVGREAFLAASPFAAIRKGLPDIDFGFCELRACPFDVNRVWYTAYPVGTHTGELELLGKVYPPSGKQWKGPPECGSVRFDASGKCIGVTSGYVMDRRQGNTDGLPGILGLLSAIGSPSPMAWTSRTPVQLLTSLTSGSG